MPSQEPAIQTLQEKGFRTSFRGFDKNDVLAYMNALANETQQRESEYEEQIDRLKAQNEKLRSEQSAARACVDKLQSDLAGATQRAETAEKAASAAAADKQRRTLIGRHNFAFLKNGMKQRFRRIFVADDIT